MITNNELDASSSLASSENVGVAVCYLCLGGGADDEDGQQLRRDCACRGTDAGFVHLSCLTKYAATKSMRASGMNEFIEPWSDCPSCHQKYQNEFRIDIASKFVSFVRKQYPRDTQRQLEALYVKRAALQSMHEKLQSEQKRELGVTANVLLSLIDRMKGEVSPLPIRYSQFEAEAYNTHGLFALNEGSEEGARRAVTHYGKALEVCEAIGNDQSIATAKRNIAIAKSKYEGGNNEEMLKASQELYEIRIATEGEDDEYTILAGKSYAIALRDAKRGEEAMELLTKLIITSKQVLGPNHNTTKVVESLIECVNNESICNDADQE
jgi:hypothetical protein